MIAPRPDHPIRSADWRSLPCRSIAILLVIWFGSEWAGGAYFGFSAFFPHLLFVVLASVLGGSAWVAAAGLFSGRGLAGLTTRAGVLTLAFVVLCGLALGATRHISPLMYGIAEGLFLVGVLALTRGRVEWMTGANPPHPVVGLWLAIVVFVIGTGLSHAPFTAYDSLSYHLFFPARWLQEHCLSIIATPFSDEAQAYQPGNGELWFLWLMLPFHGDFLARVGQLPFYFVGAMTLYALARRLGATSMHAIYAPTFFLITPTVVEQAVGANVDLIHATLFVMAVYLGIEAVDTDERRDWGLWGVTVGLFIGSKYLALVYLPVLAVIPLLRGPRARALWAVPGITVLGLPWYLRNWLIAGSPIYPATLQVAGFTIAQGAYTRQAMTHSFMHTTDPRLLLVSTMHAFGVPLFVFLAPAGVLIAAAVITRRAWWPAGFVLLAAGAIFPLCWFGVGDNTDSRFVLPAVVLSLSLLPLPFRTQGGPNTAMHAFHAAGIAWILVGARVPLRAPLPWYMQDWLSLEGVVAGRFLVSFMLLAGAAFVFHRVASRRGWPRPVLAGAVVVTGVTLAIGADTWCAPSRCDFLNVPSPHVRLDFLYGSRWITSHVRSAHIAYTGGNLPYPLSGSDLTNVVSYINIDRHADWRFHDYARAFRRAPGRLADPAALATPSGILMPIVSSTDRFDAIRPRFERMAGNRDAWIANLRSRRVEYVFVSMLDPYEVDYMWHNTQGFPIEDEWLNADPVAFRLVYDNPNVRIYQIVTP